MNSLKNIKERKSTFVLIVVLFLLSFLGLLDALYLSAAEYQGLVVTCGSGGCAEVTTSEYSRIFGIPVSYLGLLHYSVMFVFTLLVFAFKKRFLLIFPILPLSIVGVMASAWFVFAQVVLLKSICYFCMASAVSSLLLFIVTVVLVWRNQAHLSAKKVIETTDEGETEEDSD